MDFSSYSKYCVPFQNVHLRTPRKIRMVCIGSGFAGLTMAYKVMFENDLSHLIDFTIYEREKGVGGTWLANHYPGLKCDVPIHAYNLPWAPKHDWTRFYAEGPEILGYIQDATQKFGLDKYIRFESKLLSSTWEENTGKWKLKVKKKDGQILTDECDILIGATGTQSQPSPPTIPGLDSFKGPVLHTGNWDDGADCRNKKIAVIGNGSSGVQVFTALQKEGASITHFIRSRTWISLNYMSQYTRNGDGLNFSFTKEEKENFRNNPESLLAYRKLLEDTSIRLFKNLIFDETAKDLKVEFRKTLTRVMRERLNSQPDLADKLLPSFQPWCRRLTPADGYLEALQAPNATLEDAPIEAITPTGIRTHNGETDYDVIVTATGFVNNRVLPWDMVGRDGVHLERLFAKNPEAYLSICVAHMPNFFAVGCGPNFPIANGPVLSAMSWICDYIVRWTKRVIYEDTKSVCVKQDAVEAYNIYIQEILRRTAWNRECNSWYKTGTKDEYRTGISAIYPGSLHHLREMLECDLRGEDFDFTYNSKNKFNFLGNGMAEIDMDDANDLAFHIDHSYKLDNII